MIAVMVGSVVRLINFMAWLTPERFDELFTDLPLVFDVDFPPLVDPPVPVPDLVPVVEPLKAALLLLLVLPVLDPDAELVFDT